MRRVVKKTQGQLALGLAFGFIMILSLFAFVFNTSMNVREKIKLQQTTDYAALVAANAQKEYLNIIRDYNLAIEAAWFTTLARQQINHCANPLLVAPQPLTNPAGTPYSAVSASVGAFLTANQISTAEIPAVGEIDENTGALSSGGDPCEMICDQYNEAVNKRFRKQYEELRSSIETEILKIILNANQVSFRYALHHFLHPKNLPWGLQQKLESELGEGFTTQNAMQAFENNDLSREANNDEWGYDIVSDNQYDPLFVPKAEIRPFLIANHDFYTDVVQGAGGTYQPYCVSTGLFAPTITKNAQAKINKDGIFQTHFFTGVHYMPPPNMFENNEALQKKRISTDEFAQTESRLSNPSMFARTVDIVTRAAAKPYGGTYPQGVSTSLLSYIENLVSGSGDMDTPDLFKQGVGQEMTGAKLFGIADESELGGYEIYRAELEAKRVDENGNEVDAYQIRRKDYLH